MRNVSAVEPGELRRLRQIALNLPRYDSRFVEWRAPHDPELLRSPGYAAGSKARP